jgi:probable phosphoglycerate mutase
MSKTLPIIYLARHGETTWSRTGRHAGLVDVPLTKRGESEARQLGRRLRGLSFKKVFTSPLQRVSRTCKLAGFGEVAVADRNLLEWNYGDDEGKTTKQILKERPDWRPFRDGYPGGESLQQISDRADRVVRRVRAIRGNVLLFSSGHFLRVLAARWLDLEAGAGRFFAVRTASLGALGYDDEQPLQPLIRLWDYKGRPKR